MNNKYILHAPDIEDADYLEEDYLDYDSRKKYESEIRDYENRLFHKNQNKPDLMMSNPVDNNLKDNKDVSSNNKKMQPVLPFV